MNYETRKRNEEDQLTTTRGRLSINIEREPSYTKSTSDYRLTCYGNIYNLDEIKLFDFAKFKREEFTALLNRLAGFFCLVLEDLTSGRVVVANDSFGNFRLYLYEGEDRTYISNNWQALASQIRLDHGALEMVPEEQYYFHRHRYTTGGHTLVRHLDKLMPGSICTADGDKLRREIYLPATVERAANDSEYMARNHALIASNIQQGTNPEFRNILFFSGGVDSSFLACTMMDLGLEFTPVFIKYDPADGDNVVDSRKASAVADYLGLKLETIKAPIAANLALTDKVVRRHPFDKAMVIPMELAFQSLSRRYGSCNIINGQASDSIYCWGASGKTPGCLIQRFLMSDCFSKRSGFVRAAIAGVVEQVYRARWTTPMSFRVPHADSEFWLGLLDPQGYVPIVHTEGKHRQYREYLERIVTDIAGDLDCDHGAIRMYMKLMYLQGPVDLFLVEAAHAHRHQLVLPFLDARIINLKRKYQSDWRNLFHPRYVLEQVLSERFDFDVSVIDRWRKASAEEKTANEYAALQEEAHDAWDQVSAGLL
jgi:asparagine synthetase B (glutamine-hydrolysing)